ncbi:2Fe-2S iron-sulfur cluster-binding protein [Paraclostridium benzoelyticum]|uniref:2Fe-2S iron-sulfur cluster-binding protein n=1 Tax=Paraclostridium benzoelyticum TaxID=1629550 RepID=UPI0031CDA876
MQRKKDVLCDVVTKKELKEDIYLLEIRTPKILLEELLNPGSYILLRCKDQIDSRYNVPISVMDIDVENEILKVIIKEVGHKTKSLLSFDKVWVRGPYLNGVLGLKEFKLTTNSNVAVILSGLSQVNAPKIIKYILKNNNHVEVFVDTRRTILDEVIDKIKELNVNIHFINIKEDEELIKDYIRRNNVELVYSGGFNSFNKEIMKLVDSVDENIRFSIANNNLIVCGEGICGGCTVVINGKRTKSCKAQINGREYLKSLK